MGKRVREGPRPETDMIHLTKLNGSEYVLNADLIESLESTPDTTITLVSGHKMNVLEPVDEVVSRIVEYHRQVFQGPFVLKRASGDPEH